MGPYGGPMGAPWGPHGAAGSSETTIWPRRELRNDHFHKKCIFGRDLAPQGAPKRPFGSAGSWEAEVSLIFHPTHQK